MCDGPDGMARNKTLECTNTALTIDFVRYLDKGECVRFHEIKILHKRKRIRNLNTGVYV